MSEKLLEINDLHVSFHTYAGEVKVLRGVNIDVAVGESLAIVGESGSGKSVTVQTAMRLISTPPGEIKSGNILFKGVDLLTLTEKQMSGIRGKNMGMIFQNPMGALNPTMKIGHQIAESVMLHQKVCKKEAMIRALEMLKLVKMTNPEKRLYQYPHQLSGGMRQRVMIAIALACEPELLIADEPTTALDVTIQAQIITLIKELKERLKMSVILITHDLGVVADFAERVIVMYGGEIMEEASVKDIFNHPKHPYTWGLLNSIPKIDADKSTEKLIAIEGTPPNLLDAPIGCPFAPRCDYAMNICYKEKPTSLPINETHSCACFLLDERAPKVEPPKFL